MQFAEHVQKILFNHSTIIDSRIFVNDNENCYIRAFSLDNKFLFQFGSKGTENGQFQCPLFRQIPIWNRSQLVFNNLGYWNWQWMHLRSVFWSNMLLCPSIALQGKWKIQISRYFCLPDGTLQTSFLNSKLLIMVSPYKKPTTKNKSTSQVVMSSSCVCQYRLKWIRLAKQISLSVLRSLCLTKPILVLLGGNVIVKTNVSIAEIFIMTSISLLLIEVWMTLETY